MRHVVGIHTRRSLASLICSIDLISLPWLYIKFSWVHSHIAIRIFLAINLPGWRAHLGLSQPPLRTGTLTQTYQPLIWQNQTIHPPTPWQAFKMALVVSSFNTPLHPRCSPPPPLEACIGTAQVGDSLVAPLEFIFKQSSLRSSRDMIIISWYKHLYWWYASTRCSISQVRPYTRRVYTCMRLFFFFSF